MIARPGFQSWASRFPLTRGTARRDGEKLFDLVSGFVQSQVLYTLVSLDIPSKLMDGAATPAWLSHSCGVPEDRMEILLQAGVAMGLLQRERRGRFGLARMGAALLGVPGLMQMIRHHDVLYRDMADPVALFRGEVETELSSFWPYVFGADGASDPETVATYSDLMAQSQGLVAEDTLRAVSLSDSDKLLDVGGGFGVFAAAALRATPGLHAAVMDLPHVVDAAAVQAAPDVSDRLSFCAGSFRDEALPRGYDAISLIRVLYDHQDDTVRDLLRKVHAALPPRGRLLISEPMSGGAAPHRPGDVYFAVYTMAMQTGRVRSQERIAELCLEAGFESVKKAAAPRPFVTSCVTAVKPI